MAVAVLWKWIFNADSGLLNYLISVLTGLPMSECPKWLASEAWSKPALVIMSFWSVGSGMIIYLAGLQGIPTTLYEAAEIDGANKWQQFWTVTLPGLSPVLGRTHPCAPINLPRTIHKFDSANSVTSWAVFFFKPR